MPARRGASAPDAKYSPTRPTPASHRGARARSGGVPRLKSGCYTCRIRRKKCDESRGNHGNGPCEACSRLRIQCLGYGERRPSWLRDPAQLEETKLRIKGFLSQQGFSKSQRNSNSPISDSEQDILYLEPALIVHQSSHSPAPTAFSTSSHEESFLPSHELSSMREEGAPLYVADSSTLSHSSHSSDTLSPDLSYPSNALSAPYPTSGYHIYGGSDPYPTTSSREPAQYSSYGPSYSYNSVLGLDDIGNLDGFPTVPTMDLMAPADAYMPSPHALPFSDMNSFFPEAWSQELLKHYFVNVIQREYLLADRGVHGLIWQSLQRSDTARSGACLLARLHFQSLNSSQQPRALLLSNLDQQAKGLLSPYGCTDEGDAFAALQIVSCFLFLGGRGQWITYLDHATTWVEHAFNTSQYDYAETLRQKSEWERFLIKTTMWFDVLGSVTRRQAPKLLAIYRNLYHSASIDDGVSPSSMIPIMGCESAIVLALAETSALAAWKDEQNRVASLSVPTLVQAGKKIEQTYLKSSTTPLIMDFNELEDAAVQCRRLTSAVFRASARVYLHSVISGDSPGCPEIMSAVKDTVEALRRVPENDTLAERAVVRMVVFSICIAGCLTNHQPHRDFLLRRLASQQVEAVGNCGEVRKVTERVWELRAAGSNASWRDVVAQMSPEGHLLLV